MGIESYSDMVCETDAEFRVHTRVYTDPRIFEDEMRRIFETTWVYVGHESEIQQPGDYRTTAIGRQPIILSRSEDGRIHALLNVCRHRGNAVCREERGNSNFFRCPYHGWVYGNDGKLVGISQSAGYPSRFGEDIDGLVKVARVASYRGLIFASLSPEGASLEDYLKPVREYIDLWVERSPTGKLRVQQPHKLRYPGNWKFQAENGADGYHPGFVHESAFKTLAHFGLRSTTRSQGVDGTSMGFRHGHCWLSGTYRQSMPPDLLKEYTEQLAAAYGGKRMEEIARNRHVLIFPNVYLMDVNIRVIQPVAFNQTVVSSYFTWLDGVSDAVNRARLRDLQRRLGTSGFISPDDMEMFASNQTGMQASAMEWLVMSRGLDREVAGADGRREGHYSDETPQRAIYREWARLMGASERTGRDDVRT